MENTENVENLFEKMNISGVAEKQPNKRKGKQKPITGLETLDRFLLTKEINTKEDGEGSSEPVILHSTPIKKTGVAKSHHSLSEDIEVLSPLHKQPATEVHTENSVSFQSFADLSVDSTAFDLSDIVNSIVTRTNNPALDIWTKRNM